MGDTHKSGKNHRKYGRAGRRPSHNRYTIAMRWIKNKARNITKQAKKESKKSAKLKARKSR